MQRGATFVTETTMIVENCCNCGVFFAMTKAYVAECRADSGKWFYCPNGHKQHYTETEADRLRRERDRLKQNNAYEAERRERAEREADHQRARANGYKGHATKLGKRIKAGVCPCCNRTVAQLARHMQTEHPNFMPDAEPATVAG